MKKWLKWLICIILAPFFILLLIGLLAGSEKFNMRVDEKITYFQNVTVRGNALGKKPYVSINGIKVKIRDGKYKVGVSLKIDENKIKGIYKNDGEKQTRELLIKRVSKAKYLKIPGKKEIEQRRVEERKRKANEAARKRIEERKRKADEAKSKERGRVLRARVLRFGKCPSRSEWDGKVYIVVNYLKNIAKDPSSIKCDNWSEIYYDKNNGWIVRCRWYGKNSFGALVPSMNWFIIKHNRVIQIKPFDAYK